jgi:hypothetical protein
MPMRTLPGMPRPNFVDAIVVVAMFASVGFGLALFEWCGGGVTLALFGGRSHYWRWNWADPGPGRPSSPLGSSFSSSQ